MPIRAENRRHYTPAAGWPAVRAAVLKRAEYRCEGCGIASHAVGYRDAAGEFVPNCGNGPCDASGMGRTWPGYNRLSYQEAREFIEHYNSLGDGRRWLVVVLTVAHLNHDPTDNRLENLRAWCQRCHNRYDARNRAAGVRSRRRVAERSLFEEAV